MHEKTVLHFLRQQRKKAAGRTNYSLADFVAPVSSGKQDYIGAFAVTAGIGIAFLDARLTTPGLVTYPPICGWYWCVPGGVGPGTIVKAKESTEEFSYNAGIGIDFELGGSTQLYIEATYHSAETARASTDYIPIVLGVRF